VNPTANNRLTATYLALLSRSGSAPPSGVESRRYPPFWHRFCSKMSVPAADPPQGTPATKFMDRSPGHGYLAAHEVCNTFLGISEVLRTLLTSICNRVTVARDTNCAYDGESNIISVALLMHACSFCVTKANGSCSSCVTSLCFHLCASSLLNTNRAWTQASNTDRLVGGSMMLASLAIFLYYTFWVIATVCRKRQPLPLCPSAICLTNDVLYLSNHVAAFL